MSTPSPEALPVGYTFGRVVARFLRAVGEGGHLVLRAPQPAPPA